MRNVYGEHLYWRFICIVLLTISVYHKRLFEVLHCTLLDSQEDAVFLPPVSCVVGAGLNGRSAPVPVVNFPWTGMKSHNVPNC